jgi:signal transduction histidine kinase
MLTSLFFLNRNSDSGEQAVKYGRTVQRTNAIIQQTYRLESFGYGYLLNGCNDTHRAYTEQRDVLLAHYDTLKLHCERFNLAHDHAHKLYHLVNKRVSIMDDLVHRDSLHTMENRERINHMDLGSQMTDSIISTLVQIREANDEKRVDSQLLASNYNKNATFMLTVFGIVMFVIVFISFNKIKKALVENHNNVLEINQINAELKSMNENLENFAYVASHDLNEPLRKIRTFGDMVHSEMNNPSIDKGLVTSHIERMQSASARMQQLINDLLSYSRVSREFNAMESIDLKKTIESVVNDLEIRIAESKAEIKIGKLPEVMLADEIQMRQLFQNLISNALKFSKKDVSPKVTISATQITNNEIPLEEAKEMKNRQYWKIDVSDNGIGFDQKYAQKIFAVFQRLHGVSTYEGTGIGLSICKKICENHKGFITVSSTEGEGSTFSVFFPKTNA